MIYFKLGNAELAKTLDIKGRNKAVAANLFPALTILGVSGYWIVTQNVGGVSILLGLMAVVVSFIIGVYLQTSAVIESVYRGKDGKNKKIYQKNKVYFEKKFKKHGCSDRPCLKRHIIEQQGGDNNVRRK